jgi:sugar phosphate isomerase/epimerase
MAPTLSTPAAFSRRDFLKFSGAASAAALVSAATPRAFAASAKKIPVGIELYAVRGELQKDLKGTVTRVAKMGYECVEFYSPYLGWTPAYAKEIRTLLDDLGIKCHSTHNPAAALTDEGSMTKAIELNQLLGSRYIIAASPPRGVTGVDGWKRVAEQFSAASTKLKTHGLFAGFHNHGIEWQPLLEGGPHAMRLLAQGTPKEFALQLDVGTALSAGVDCVAWIKANPGRIRSVHLKDWTPGTKEEEKAYRVLFAEGIAPWKEIFAAAESVGGAEFYLMEQEGSRYSEFETAERCLATYRKLRG